MYWILIKLMSIVALVIAPHISERPHGEPMAERVEVKKEIKYEDGKKIVTETKTIVK